MRKNESTKFIFLVLFMSAIIFAPSFARNLKPATSKSSADSTEKDTYGSHLVPILNTVNATSEQRQRITEIFVSHKPKIEPLKQEYRQKSQEFIDCIVSGKPSELVMYEQSELNRLHGQIASQYSLIQLEIRKVLTPQQWKMFQEYKQKEGWRTSENK